MKLRNGALVLAASMAMLLLSCGEGVTGPEGKEGAAGAEGEAGAVGPAGAQGEQGLAGAPGAEGPAGPSGDQGLQGEPGSKGDPGEQGAPGAQGPAGAQGEQGPAGPQGEKGDQGEQGPQGEKGDQGDKGDQGAPGPSGELQTEPDGVVGVVTDGSGDVVPSGTVYFVPAADVAALPATSVEVGSANDEPLEDLIAANGASYLSAEVGEDGVYAVTSIEAGTYFVTFVPGEVGHLPGGSLCREALSSADLVGQRYDIEVSAAIPPMAYYVGTGTCVNCHGKVHVSRTMHKLGIWSPYQYGMLQDVGFRKDDLTMALGDRFTETGTTVWFYDFDSSRGFDKYKTSETEPAAPAVVSFTVTARRMGADYEMVIHNVKDPAQPDAVIRVDAIYGGGVYKQRYLTRIEGGSGFYYATMPLQFQHEGDETYTDRTRKVWRDYHGDWWYDEGASSLTNPAPKRSFEKNCVSCHAVGSQVTGSDAAGWTVSLLSNPTWGDFDYDGDGVADELNVSCETCHGPGSAHWESAGQGRHIVNPRLLTPERDAMICGQCHSRPKGALGSDSPVNADGFMMVAGTSRNEFLANYATTQLDGAASDFYGDDLKHSKSHHQQYSDFIRSGMYKNDAVLMTCADCHDPHEADNVHQLRADPTDNVAMCGSCHSDQAGDLVAHVDLKVGAGMGAAMAEASCTECHMPKTAKTGAGRPGIAGHWQNDISSHMFDMPAKELSSASGVNMPTAYTNACGSCHAAVP